MENELTLPGSIPGLLRRGSPVVMPDGERGTVCSLWSDEGVWALVVSCADLATGTGWSESTPTRKCALDLTDATGRAHTAWWVAERGGSLRPVDACNALWVHEAGERMWSLWSLWAPLADACDVYGPYEDDKRLRVAALAHLDPDDPRTLPDGSRWVDAEALRLVVLHLAGVPDGQ